MALCPLLRDIIIMPLSKVYYVTSSRHFYVNNQLIKAVYLVPVSNTITGRLSGYNHIICIITCAAMQRVKSLQLIRGGGGTTVRFWERALSTDCLALVGQNEPYAIHSLAFVPLERFVPSSSV